MWPILSETGEQELLLNLCNCNVASRKIFGFEPRYNHLRFGEKTVHGDFRTNFFPVIMQVVYLRRRPNLNENLLGSTLQNVCLLLKLQDVGCILVRCSLILNMFADYQNGQHLVQLVNYSNCFRRLPVRKSGNARSGSDGSPKDPLEALASALLVKINERLTK